MKNKILICTIARNAAETADEWYSQISSLVKKNKDIDFSISIYENDSDDDTAEKLASFDYKSFSKNFFKTETLETKFHGSTKDSERVVNLANARNKTLDQAGDLNEYDNVIFIEPDVTYEPEEASQLFRQEETYGQKFDILSGASVYSEQNIFYDTWCTRQEEGHDGFPPVPVGNLRAQMERAQPGARVISCWTTFSCFCVYNARPFAEGVRFSGLREKEVYDCDTALICEFFREKGYKNIAMDTGVLIRHDTLR